MPDVASFNTQRVNAMRTKAPFMLYLCSPRLNQFLILSALTEDPFLTQAALAHRCGLSVAMVNNYLKELCEAGLMEYRRKSLKSVSYHVTDLGRAQVEIVESELTSDVIERFTLAKERMQRRILSQSPNARLRRVVLYGSGPLAELVFHALMQADVRVIGICDEDPRFGPEWCGCPAIDPSQVARMRPDAIIITDWNHTDTAWNRLKELFNGNFMLIRLDGRPAYGTPPETDQPELQFTFPWA
jgi:DNA-binding MarR family transcriptional regulator